MRYSLRTLLIVFALGPPLLWMGWTKYKAWQVEQEQLKMRQEWLDRFGMMPPPGLLKSD